MKLYMEQRGAGAGHHPYFEVLLGHGKSRGTLVTGRNLEELAHLTGQHRSAWLSNSGQ